MRTLIALLLTGLPLAGCFTPARDYVTSETQDDKTCRSFMRNKAKSDSTTYAECRQNLIDLANMPAYAPAEPNVTVIVNR